MLNLLFGRKGGLFGPRARGPRPRKGLFGGIRRPGGPRFRGPGGFGPGLDGPGPEGFGPGGPGPMGGPPYGWGGFPPPRPPGAFYYDELGGGELDGFGPPYPPRPFDDDF